MASNVFLFTGEVDFFVYQEVNRYKKGFIDKFGKESISEFYPDNFSIERIMNALFSGGLFVQKSMIIIHGFPLETERGKKLSKDLADKFETEFMGHVQNLSPDTIVLFVAPFADKRSKGFKQISTIAQLKEFTIPKRRTDWYSETCPLIEEWCGGLIAKQDAEYLLTCCGDNLYHCFHECEKLAAYAKVHNLKKIDKELIDLIIYKSPEIDNFAVFADLFTDKTKVLGHIKDAQENSFRSQYLGLLFWGLRAIITTLERYEQGERNSFKLAGKVGAAPGTIDMILKHAETLAPKKEEFEKSFQKLLDLDYSIKSGKLPEDFFWPTVKEIMYGL